MAVAVIDASMASAWCFPDEETDYTKAVFQAVSSSAVDPVAPRLWAYEIRNSVLMGLRRGRISQPDSEKFLVALNELNVRLSAYLDLAVQESLPLASLDRQLIRAAQEVGVPLFLP
jgi:predicted nucleic acid-binding protein